MVSIQSADIYIHVTHNFPCIKFSSTQGTTYNKNYNILLKITKFITTEGARTS